ncbi:citrate/2-methylcitrate synthase [Asticcacaulis benevestitus]|uniref:citrate synthase (unknown stereospecificity) n=1 Tax=Asticcacaulis benevestitus DSM 16100 = ATCC BAA-896 TaxID=1121022 RepID=V4PZG3_9CAUL|nr:citrate/2-methylcitrate synthase [Asticcacaulis benevestitus]ESQ93766.1 citrate synthase [Asticcacaulis benevestitus DSM 16100 = ATCC BAA-896]
MSRVWISRTEALKRLDVKPQTLYAYVSRQRIAAKSDPSHPRMSLYALDDVERLSRRAPGRLARTVHGSATPADRPLQSLSGGTITRGEAAIDTEIAITIDGHHYIRGRDIVSLAASENFEAVAALLWRAETSNPFGPLKPRPDVNFPGGPRTRVLSMLSRRLEEDALSDIDSSRDLGTEAASLLNEMFDSVTNGGPRLFFHQRLARAWKVYDAKDVDLLRRALVLCADTNLDEATLAVRVSAATMGPLAIPLMSGFATLTGPKLGGRISRAESYVTAVRRSGNPLSLAKSLLEKGLELPGFEKDPSPSETLRAYDLINAAPHMGEDLKAILRVGEDLTGQSVGMSLALALIGRHLDLPREAPVTLYGLSRSAGWLAHAIEQMQTGASPKARLRYIGVHPQA